MTNKETKFYEVEGFSFSSESEAEQAKKEIDGINYVKARLDRNQPQQMLKLYNKMVDEKLFVTAVGLNYLADLRKTLLTIPFLNKEEIQPVPVVHAQEEPAAGKKALNVENGKNLQKKLRTSVTINVILAVCVILMFVISATSNHPTILNYEKELVNRYSAWEKTLTERESAIREWEQSH